MKSHSHKGKCSPNMKVSPTSLKKKNAKILARWTDGIFYFVKVTRVSESSKTCLVQFEDKSTGQVNFKDLLEGHEDGDMECHVCGETDPGVSNAIVSCSNCERVYHQHCHEPAIKEEESGDDFICRICVFASCVQTGGAKTNGHLAEKFAVMKQSLPYELKHLTWQSNHTRNEESLYCYCGGPGCWYNKMLQCCRCRQWFHEACLQCLKEQLLVGDHFYVFACSRCNNGKEFLHRMDMKWAEIVHVSLFHLVMTTGERYVDVDDITTCVMNHGTRFKLRDLLNGKHGNWTAVCKQVQAAVLDKEVFLCAGEHRKKKTLYGLRERVPRAPTSYSLPVPSIKLSKENLLQASSTPHKCVKFSPSKNSSPVSFINKSSKKSVTPPYGRSRNSASKHTKVACVKSEHNYCTPLKCPDRPDKSRRSVSPSSASSSSDTIDLDFYDTNNNPSPSKVPVIPPASPTPSPPELEKPSRRTNEGKKDTKNRKVAERGGRENVVSEKKGKKKRLREETAVNSVERPRTKRRRVDLQTAEEVIAELNRGNGRRLSRSKGKSLSLPSLRNDEGGRGSFTQLLNGEFHTKNDKQKEDGKNETKRSENVITLTKKINKDRRHSRNSSLEGRRKKERKSLPDSCLKPEKPHEDTSNTNNSVLPEINVDLTPPSSSLSSPNLDIDLDGDEKEDDGRPFWSLDIACPPLSNYSGANHPFLTDYEQKTLRFKRKHFEDQLNRFASTIEKDPLSCSEPSSQKLDVPFLPPPPGLKSVSGFKSELKDLIKSVPESHGAKTPGGSDIKSRKGLKKDSNNTDLTGSRETLSNGTLSLEEKPLIVNGVKISPALFDTSPKRSLSSPSRRSNGSHPASTSSSPVNGRQSRHQSRERSIGRGSPSSNIKNNQGEEESKAAARKAEQLKRRLKNLIPTCGFSFPVLESSHPALTESSTDDSAVPKSSTQSSPLQTKPVNVLDRDQRKKGCKRKFEEDDENVFVDTNTKPSGGDQENIRRSHRSRTVVNRFQAALDTHEFLPQVSNSDNYNQQGIEDEYEVVSLRLGWSGKVEYLIDWDI